jgi:hypothetical protein
VADSGETRPESLQIVLAEFAALRGEIQGRSSAAWTLLGLNLTASSAVAGFVLSDRADPLLLLLLPFLSSSLGLLFLDHGINLDRIGTYIKQELKPRATRAGGDPGLLAYED